MPPLEIRVAPLAPGARLPQLDELKGLAILLVILYHAGGVLVWNNYFHGDVGVDLFLILSGFGLALSSREESFGAFALRRLKRLMPAYWVILLLYVVCNQVFLQHKYSWLNIGAHVAGAHGLFGDQIGLAINDSFWFVTAILFAYGCFYFLRRKLAALDEFILLSGAISATVALGLFFATQPGLMGHVGFRLPSFFAGMVLGQLVRTGSIQIAMTAKCAVGLCLFAYVPYTRGIVFFSLFVALALGTLYVAAVRPLLPSQSRVRAAFRWAGEHSLEIFLIHQPLMREYNYYLHGRWLNDIRPSALSLSVGMVLALIATAVISVELRRAQRSLLGS